MYEDPSKDSGSCSPQRSECSCFSILFVVLIEVCWMIFVCLLCTYSWHIFVRSPFAYNAASCSVEVLLMSLRFSARLTSVSELDCLEQFRLKCLLSLIC